MGVGFSKTMQNFANGQLIIADMRFFCPDVSNLNFLRNLLNSIWARFTRL